MKGEGRLGFGKGSVTHTNNHTVYHHFALRIALLQGVQLLPEVVVTGEHIDLLRRAVAVDQLAEGLDAVVPLQQGRVILLRHLQRHLV